MEGPGNTHGGNDRDPPIEEDAASGGVPVGEVEPERDQNQQEDQDKRRCRDRRFRGGHLDDARPIARSLLCHTL